jgi:hypothetical protein
MIGLFCIQPEGEEANIKHILKPGKEMVAAGYCMYGSSANLVISTGQGVNGYTLDNVNELSLFFLLLFVMHKKTDSHLRLWIFKLRVGHWGIHLNSPRYQGTKARENLLL